MDFKQPSTSTNPFATSVAAILFGLCLLNCGCQPAPAGGDAGDSKSNRPAKADAAESAKSVSSSNKESSGKGPAKKAVKKPQPPKPDVNDVRFHPAVKAAAEKYLQYAMVNTTGAGAEQGASPDTFLEDPTAKMSQAESAHGQKLYFLFAKNIGHYVNPDGTESPVGQALVNESWTAVPGNPDARNLRSHSSGNRVNPRVTIGEKTVKLGKRSDLFVMVKQDPKTAGTDQGWVYGVIDPKSYEIKSAGAVASCIACHQGEQDRLFRDGIIDWEAEAIKQAKAEAEAKKSKSPADSETDK